MQMVPQPSFNGGYTRSFDSSYQGESGYTTGIEDNLLALQDVSVVQQNFNATNCNVGNVWNVKRKVAEQIQTKHWAKEYNVESYESTPWIQAIYFELSTKCDEFKGIFVSKALDSTPVGWVHDINRGNSRQVDRHPMND